MNGDKAKRLGIVGAIIGAAGGVLSLISDFMQRKHQTTVMESTVAKEVAKQLKTLNDGKA